MKKVYENAKLDIVEFDADVITSSGGDSTPDVAGFGFDVPYDEF